MVVDPSRNFHDFYTLGEEIGKYVRHMFIEHYYPLEVRRGEYCGFGIFLLQYSPLVKI